MERYPLEVVDEHLVARIGDRRVLLDTGAPQSIGTGALTILGREYPLRAGWLGFDIPQLVHRIGGKIDALLGSDILGRVRFVIDRPLGVVSFAEEALDLAGTTVAVDSLLGVPVVECHAGGKPTRAFLDTAARLSYVDPALTEHCEPVGEACDFYPGFGEFVTQVFRIPIVFAGRTRELTCGRLPELLQMALQLAGTDWILGAELFKDRAVAFDMLKGHIVVADHAG